LRATPLGSGLAAAQQIAFGKDVDKLPGLIHHRKTADVVVTHQPNGLGNGRVAPDRNDVSGYDLLGVHGGITRARRNLPGGDSSSMS
jgi:hypothetical protein